MKKYFMDGEFILKNGKVDMYCFDGGFCSIDNNNGRKQGLYYYNKDHLGNNREVVAADGTIAQTNNYYPFGTPFNEGTSSSSELQPYKYNGKELDRMHGLDTYDYGARNYDAVIPAWTSVDPLCEKYYNVSPYVYCADNPIKFIDSDGRKIKIAKGSSSEFIAQYNRAVTYLEEHNADGEIKKLEQRKETITISESRKSADSYNHNEINWNPKSGLFTMNGNLLSPAINLVHECGHALKSLVTPTKYKNDSKPNNSVYQSKEEKRDILNVETPAAIRCGEIKPGTVSREDHSGVAFKTENSTSVEILNKNDPSVNLMIMCWKPELLK